MDARDPPPPSRPLKVKCPTCAGPSIYASTNPWRPFCSERCREIDLGAWASERFRVAGDATDDVASSDASPPAASPRGH